VSKSRHNDKDVIIPPVLLKLDRLDTEALRALLRTVPGVNQQALDRATDAALRDAFKSYWRTGKLTEAAIFNCKGGK
jgi:hypothetical protein